MKHLQSITEGITLHKTMKLSRKYIAPFSIVAIENNKVVGQDIDVKIREMIPAAYRELAKKYPNAKIHVEDSTGAVINEGSYQSMMDRISTDDARKYLKKNYPNLDINVYDGYVGLENMSFDGITYKGIDQSDKFAGSGNRKQSWISGRGFGDKQMSKSWFIDKVKEIASESLTEAKFDKTSTAYYYEDVSISGFGKNNTIKANKDSRNAAAALVAYWEKGTDFNDKGFHIKDEDLNQLKNLDELKTDDIINIKLISKVKSKDYLVKIERRDTLLGVPVNNLYIWVSRVG